jgi:hypothetical protein
MEFKNLKNIVFEIVAKIFEKSGKVSTNEKDVQKVADKCFDVALRQIQFIVNEYIEEINQDAHSAVIKNNIDLAKKHLEKIDKTFDSYYSNEYAIEHEKIKSSKISPSILKDLILKLESISNYEPDFILNIRDMSAEAWKSALNFEKTLSVQKKEYENIISSKDTKWRNRTEFIKYKTAIKIIKLQGQINIFSGQILIITERFFMQIEDLRASLIAKIFDEEKLKNLVKKSGFKDVKALINGITKIEAIKAKNQSQLDTLRTENKNIKAKLTTSNEKLEDYKKKLEKSEEIIKNLEKNLQKALESSKLNLTNNKTTEFKEKNLYKADEPTKIIEDNPKPKKLTHIETEVSSLSPKRNNKSNIIKAPLKSQSNKKNKQSILISEKSGSKNLGKEYPGQNRNIAKKTSHFEGNNLQSKDFYDKNSPEQLSNTLKDQSYSNISTQRHYSVSSSIPSINLATKGIQNHSQSIDDTQVPEKPTNELLNKDLMWTNQPKKEKLNEILAKLVLKTIPNEDASNPKDELFDQLNQMTTDEILNIKLKINGEDKTIHLR